MTCAYMHLCFGRSIFNWICLAVFSLEFRVDFRAMKASSNGSKSCVRKKVRKRGTKAEPLCNHCGLRGHNASSCESLAKKLLGLLRKKHSAEQLQTFLASAHAAELVGCDRKALKTLKRAKGNRNFRTRVASKAGASKKSKKGRSSKKKNRDREAQRKPRSRVHIDKQPSVNRDSVQRAYNFLKRTGWCWQRTTCHCGGSFENISFKHSQCRGHGRRFVRCADCGSYRDVLSWSHLPILRLSLPCVVEAMKRWFAGSTPPSADEIGRQLGMSGQSKSALRRLVDTLATHEATLASEEQDQTWLSGAKMEGWYYFHG